MSSLHMHIYLHELLPKEIQTIMRADCSHDFSSTLIKSLQAKKCSSHLEMTGTLNMQVRL